MQTNAKDMFGLTADDRSAAYSAIKDRYNLKHQQRTQIDHSLSYSMLMFYAHNGKWDHVAMLLRNEGIA